MKKHPKLLVLPMNRSKPASPRNKNRWFLEDGTELKLGIVSVTANSAKSMLTTRDMRKISTAKVPQLWNITIETAPIKLVVVDKRPKRKGA